MKILILGATGMLGYSLFSNLNEQNHLSVFCTVRNITGKEKFFRNVQRKIITGVHAYDISSLQHAIETVVPDIVINCVGLIKQHGISNQHIDAIKINALLPHEIANICDKVNAKLIHFSTDCVFTGDVGLYNEYSLPDALDLYGKSKFLGEVGYGKHLTLRTSIIGHELNSAVSLVDWFLSQGENINGFSKAVFSGLPTCYISKVLVEYILPNPELAGVLHLSADPIDKYSLLKLIAEQYQKKITITDSQELVIDRSLNSNKFRQSTQYNPPVWSELVEYMHTDYVKRYKA
tara:strand:+ start:21272 stop:22144 length:873 start_codon:yes stop_codon:yes gene_type:complete